jgi:recombination protein RecA
MQLGDGERPPIDVIPSGSIGLDEALGVGGIPRGRVVELFGPESSGKTSIALRAVAQAQKLGLNVCFIDAEHAMDPDWAGLLGVDVTSIVLNQPDTGEQGLEVADMAARSGQFGLLVVDSVAALVPKAEIEGSMGDSHVGLQARLMSQALRKLTGHLNESKTTALFINQLRERVGVVYGSPETTTGGKALKFYSSVRLDVRRIETLKEGTESTGIRIRVKVVKNKLSPPFKQAEMDIMFGAGFTRTGELIDLGSERGIITKSGAWYAFEGVNIGQGKPKAIAALEGYPASKLDEIEAAIRAAGPPGARPRGKLTPSEQAPWGDDSSGT